MLYYHGMVYHERWDGGTAVVRYTAPTLNDSSNQTEVVEPSPAVKSSQHLNTIYSSNATGALCHMLLLRSIKPYLHTGVAYPVNNVVS